MVQSVIFFGIAILSFLFSGPSEGARTQKERALVECLEEDWGVDRRTAAYLVKKFEPLLQSVASHHVIDSFVEKSRSIQINFSTVKELHSLPPDDGLLCAPKQHLVIFENPYVRILWGSTLPGEREPFHVHAWKSLLVVLKPTTFKMEYPNGSVEQWEGVLGVYELPANERYACTNIGSTPDEILRFEVKD